MKIRQFKGVISCIALMALLCCGCAKGEEVKETKKEVADASEMATPEELDTEGLTVVEGSQLKNGTYQIQVDSSSPMFNIVACDLEVADGTMMATMTMGGTGYLYVYLGTGEEAIQASEDAYLPYTELATGEHSFTIPVSALNQEISCAAYSKKKEQWYDRSLVFRADSLPMEAYASQPYKTPAELKLEEGKTYEVEAKLSGGSGKASIQNPTVVTLQDDKMLVTLVWSSSNYDYMVVDDQKYLNENEGGSSTFTVEMKGMGMEYPVKANTTAMSTPHEIEYTIYLDPESVKEK